MSVFTKVLRVGEGKKVRRLAELVPLVNDLEPEMEARSDEELRAATTCLPPTPGGRRDPRGHAGRGLCRGPRGSLAGAGPAAFRRPAHGGHGPPLRVDRRDEDGRGEDPRVDPARLLERAGRQRSPCGHRQRLPGQPGCDLDGTAAQLPRPHRRPRRPGHRGSPGQAPGIRVRRDLRDQHRVRVRLPARQHGSQSGRHGPARAITSPSSTRWTPSSSTRPGPR